MKIHYIAIGNELLDGRVLNTNQQFISEQLWSIGLPLRKSLTINDDLEHIKDTINEERLNADILIITGGLGPTEDDMTTQALCDALLIKTERSKKIEKKIKNHFEKRNRPWFDTNLKQADFPLGSTILDNELGTAPGYFIEKGGCLIIVLPGVPREMKAIFKSQLLSLIKVRIPKHNGYRLKQHYFCIGCGESELAAALTSLYPLPEHISIGYRAKSPEIQVTLESNHQLKQRSQTALKSFEKKLYPLIKKWVFTTEEQSFSEYAIAFFTKKKIKISIAESCTGGLLASILTQVSGSSAVLEQCCVTYSNESKSTLLQVPLTLITEHGAVSKQVARSMVNGLLNISRATHGISITGIAGPDGGTTEKPVGTVYIGIKTPAKTVVKHCYFSGNRDMIRQRAAYHALLLLMKHHE